MVANFKNVGGHYVYNGQQFLPCHGNRSGFSIRIKVGDRNVEVGGKAVTRAVGLALGPGAWSPGKLLKSEPLKVLFLHYGARKRSFLTEPYILYFPAFYSTVLIILQTK